MLIIYNDEGKVDQTILVGDFERLAEVYKSHGHKVAYATGIPLERLHQVWVKDDIVELRPEIKMIGEIRAIKADGIDTLRLNVMPRIYKLTVKLHDIVVHQEEDTDGVLDFAVDHPGTYVLTFEADFPYFPTELTVEAT